MNKSTMNKSTMKRTFLCLFCLDYVQLGRHGHGTMSHWVVELCVTCFFFFFFFVRPKMQCQHTHSGEGTHAAPDHSSQQFLDILSMGFTLACIKQAVRWSGEHHLYSL
jgi:hypothetical protein